MATTAISSSPLDLYVPSKLLSCSKPSNLRTLTHTSLSARKLSRNDYSKGRDSCFVLCSREPRTPLVTETEETQQSNLRKLCVINLPWSFSVANIKILFGQCGTVSDVEIVEQKEGRSTGVAFVTMASREEAQAAIHKLHSHELSGEIIRVEFVDGFKKARPTSHVSPIGELPRESLISMEGLVHCSANYVPLSPISFLERSAKVYRDRTSIVYGSVKFTWSETYQRCLKLASALSQLGICRGDVVATMAPNVPAMYELHFAVPMAGAVICTLNTRHDANLMSILMKHSEAKIVFVDYQFLHIAYAALDLMAKTDAKPPILVIISELDDFSPATFTSDAYEYESILANGNGEFEIRRPKSELDPISINYTSGTTSSPKGVVFNHRGAYLNSIATFLVSGMSAMPVYLWTVPMFHCNGWCLVWGVAAQGGTNICMRKVSPNCIFDNIVLHNVTHMGGAPTVLNMIVNSPDQTKLPHKVEIMTGGAPPPSQILFKMEELGFGVSHLYGLTETYGPGTYCVWKPEWESLSPDDRSKMKARQGMQHICLEDVDVKDPFNMISVPADGKTLGEVMFRGNTVMSGYFKDLKATKESFKGGWFRSGDLAVRHSDGYIEVKDRQKDIIISGGENISTVEVETVLYSHPAILEAAVVARPDDFWGQTPCAFVKLKPGFNLTTQQVITFCRDHLPHYMAPRTVVFDDLPRTSTGKLQKFLLREKAKSMGSLCEEARSNGCHNGEVIKIASESD